MNYYHKTYKSKISFNSRKEKAHYIFDKYKEILNGDILDVGADVGYLRAYIEKENNTYTGIGFGHNLDLEIDLDKKNLPYEDNSFDCVLCFDVLEHLERFHEIFEELVRVSKKSIIISLPNPWSEVFYHLIRGDFSSDESIKFYGLPNKPPIDRHRWFFHKKDIIKFFEYQCKKLPIKVIQLDSTKEDKILGVNLIKGFFIRLIMRIIFRKDILDLGINQGPIWILCEKTINKNKDIS